MYRTRIRPRPNAAPVGGLVLIFLLLFSAWISRVTHPGAAVPHAPTKRSESGSRTVELAPYGPPDPRPVPSALPFTIGEPSGVLWDLNDRGLLWAQNPHLVGGLASTTKLMTYYLAVRDLRLDRTLRIGPVAAGTTGSDISMAVGEHYTVRQLLFGLLMASANDSAVALAQAAGGLSRFVAQMNATAAAFNMQGTHYADPDGLSPGSRGTAWDLATIARLDLENPLFRRIVDTKTISLPNNPIVRNLNGLLYLDPTVIGLKTGWTTAAGFNVVFAARRNVAGREVTLLGVLMHGQSGFPPVYTDAEKLLNWGFAHLPKAASPKVPLAARSRPSPLSVHHLR